jgi:HKD family nuclease
MITLIHHPDDQKRLGDLLVENLSSRKWTTFLAAVAFVKNSGVKHIKGALGGFLARGEAKISAGIDHAGTSKEGLTELLAALGTKGEGWVFQNSAGRSTFHPKVYLFENATSAECFIGSGNLTEGGLYTNYEAFAHLKLRKSDEEEQAVLARLESILNTWTDASQGVALRLSRALIQELVDKGFLPTEAQIARTSREAQAGLRSGAKQRQGKSPFGSKAVRPAPKVASGAKSGTIGKAGGAAGMDTGLTGFFMTLQQTDVGVGQTTRGTSRRSPEIFVPLAARDANPGFWGWSDLFVEDPSKAGKHDRTNAPMLLRGRVIQVNMMTWPDKSDFRLRNAELRDSGHVGDVLRVVKADGKAGYDYVVEVVGPGSAKHAQYAEICINAVRNSRKRWGYR